MHLRCLSPDIVRGAGDKKMNHSSEGSAFWEDKHPANCEKWYTSVIISNKLGQHRGSSV